MSLWERPDQENRIYRRRYQYADLTRSASDFARLNAPPKLKNQSNTEQPKDFLLSRRVSRPFYAMTSQEARLMKAIDKRKNKFANIAKPSKKKSRAAKKPRNSKGYDEGTRLLKKLQEMSDDRLAKKREKKRAGKKRQEVVDAFFDADEPTEEQRFAVYGPSSRAAFYGQNLD